jgi:hypothetical protein
MPNMVMERTGSLLVVVQNRIDPSDAEWDQEVAMVKQRLLKTILVVTDGGAPNALQRSRYTQAAEEQRILVAVVTDSPIAVAVLTCISWFAGKREMRAFRPHDFKQAVAHLGLEDQEVTLRRVVEKLRSQLSGDHARMAT